MVGDDEDLLVQVKMGEYRIIDAGVLKSTLGSCVGISFYWPRKTILGFAHCLLPMRNLAENQLGAKYVDQGVYSLIKTMDIGPYNKKEIEVSLFGGSAMIQFSKKQNIGELNILVAKEVLNELGFKISHEDIGGSTARHIMMSASSGKVILPDI